MDETADKPKWLLELENRKRKPRLAHEAGAGAACLICNAACPGLDLHFWRKICKNCKCSRDDHDVNDDDFPQFDLLFGPTGKFKKKAMSLQVPNKKQHEAETAFDWVPPDTTKELAADYMNALPKDKLPIKGSAGAALRRQLLQKQLPLHDIDQKACNNLSDEEKKQFGKYLENLKKCVGQGKVTKILGARPFNRALMTPANATDMHRLSPQQKSPSAPAAHLRTPSSFNPKITQTLHSKIPYNSDNDQNPDTNQNPACNASVKANAQVPERHNGVLSAISNNCDIANSEQLQQGAYSNPQYSNIFVSPRKSNQPPTSREQSGTNAPNHQTNSVESSHPQPESAMPINHPTVRTLPHCQVACSEKCSCQVPSESAMFSVRHETNLPCPNNCNDPQVCPSLANVPQESVRAQNYKDTVKGPLSSLVRSENVNPEDALAAETMLANALLPPSAVHSGDIIGSTLDEKGLTYIREKLSNKYSMQENQVPPNVIPSEADVLLKKRSVAKQDDAASSNKEAQRECIIAAMKNPSGFSTLTKDKPPEIINAEVETKSTAPNRQIYGLSKGDRGHLEENGNPAQPANAASLLQPTGAYQFNGATENADRVHQIPAAPGQPEAICNQDQQKIRCSLPKTDTPTHLMNANCLQSELNTSGPVHSNVIHSEGLKNQVFPHEAVGTATLVTQTQGNLDAMVEGLEISPKKVQKCHECQGEIRVGDVAVIAEKAKNEAWHPGCFACSVCNELLVDLVYFYYKGKLYCGRDLATFLGIPRCFACDELIFVREYTVAEGHNYHVEHFCCWDCDVPLAGQKYISENDRPLCLMCYQKTYAETCNACNVVIAADQQGVAIKNLNFHATEACFCCVICKKNLLNSRMAIKEGKLFCSKECISVFGNQSSST